MFTIPTLQWPNFSWQWIHCSDFEAQPWLTKKTRKTPEKLPGKPWVTKKTRKKQRKNTWPIIQVQFRCQQCRDKSLFGQAMDDRWQQKRQTIFFIREGINYVLLVRLFFKKIKTWDSIKKKNIFMPPPIRQVFPFVLLDVLVWFRHHAASSIPFLFRFCSCLLLLFNMFWIL